MTTSIIAAVASLFEKILNKNTTSQPLAKFEGKQYFPSPITRNVLFRAPEPVVIASKSVGEDISGASVVGGGGSVILLGQSMSDALIGAASFKTAVTDRKWGTAAASAESAITASLRTLGIAYNGISTASDALDIAAPILGHFAPGANIANACAGLIGGIGEVIKKHGREEVGLSLVLAFDYKLEDIKKELQTINPGIDLWSDNGILADYKTTWHEFETTYKRRLMGLYVQGFPHTVLVPFQYAINYKYRNTVFKKFHTVAEKIALPTLSIFVAVSVIITVAGVACPPFSLTGIAIGGLVALAKISALFYRVAKYRKSHFIFSEMLNEDANGNITIDGEIVMPAEDFRELKACLPASHKRFGGVSVGDFFRFLVATLMADSYFLSKSLMGDLPDNIIPIKERLDAIRSSSLSMPPLQAKLYQPLYQPVDSFVSSLSPKQPPQIPTRTDGEIKGATEPQASAGILKRPDMEGLKEALRTISLLFADGAWGILQKDLPLNKWKKMNQDLEKYTIDWLENVEKGLIFERIKKLQYQYQYTDTSNKPTCEYRLRILKQILHERQKQQTIEEPKNQEELKKSLLNHYRKTILASLRVNA